MCAAGPGMRLLRETPCAVACSASDLPLSLRIILLVITNSVKTDGEAGGESFCPSDPNIVVPELMSDADSIALAASTEESVQHGDSTVVFTCVTEFASLLHLDPLELRAMFFSNMQCERTTSVTQRCNKL